MCVGVSEAVRAWSVMALGASQREAVVCESYPLSGGRCLLALRGAGVELGETLSRVEQHGCRVRGVSYVPGSISDREPCVYVVASCRSALTTPE